MATGTTPPDEPSDIAIVGIALRFPGAHTPAAFWANLRAGVESVRPFTDAELAARGVPARLLRDPAYVKSGPVLDGIDLFDAEFFGFSPKDAAILDPQHRQFLEVAWEALEDAGHPPATFRGPIGVFAGCGMGSYFTFNLLSNPALVESVGLFLLRHTGNDKDFLTTRVSYCLNLKGPSINLQTACSTSLVAVHTACQSLLGGECDLALAGGVTIEIPHGVGYLCREGEILSPDGHCRPFDHRSQGTIFGSGAGVVALRRLEDAVREGDRIYAVVKGSAVNNDGAGKVSYLAPSVDGQAAVVAEALAIAGVESGTIDYIETHGSGTPMGEPIEVAALSKAFGPSPLRKGFCGLGSVKANIGHLDTAAGVASLIKVALALHHGEIPPTPNFEAANPEIPLADSPFYVVDRLQPWPRGTRPRRAGVTALGVGGTNAHVVLEESPDPVPATNARREWHVLCLSAKNTRALDDQSKRLATHLRENPAVDMADAAFTLLSGRHAFEHRRVLACRDREDAVALLESLDPQRVFTHAAASSPASVVFLLPGGGAQHARMGCELYESEPAFREHVDRGIDELKRRKGLDLRPVWIAPADPETARRQLERPSVQLPAIFILEHALAQYWASVGVRPDALIGHSLGENAAACLAGVLSFEDALGLIALRGELFEQLPEGGMLSVPLSPEDVTPWLGRDLDLAAVNSPGVSVVSGPTAALEDLARRLIESGVEAKRVPITTAAHSRRVEPILPRFLEHLQSIRLHPPRIPFLSNCTGTWITNEEAVRPQYWVDHLRSPVRFADGVRTLLADPRRVFLEVGPGKSLSSLLRQQPDAGAVRGVITSLRHAEEKISDTAHFLTAFGRLWACGVPVEPEFLWRGEQRKHVSLPTYAFQRRRYWIDPGKPAEIGVAASTEPGKVDLLSEGFYRPVWRQRSGDPAPEAGTPRTWLLFLDGAGIGDVLARRLRARGDKVVTVRESDDNRRLAEGEYALAPERGREGYADLVKDLVATGAVPERIVHLWMLTPNESFRPGSNFFHHNQERGFYSLFFLAQALGEEGVRDALHITVAGNGMQALEGERLLHPGKATVAGPCKVIPREFPGLTCSTVDLPLPVSKSRSLIGARRSVRAEPWADILEREVFLAPRCATVAYRKDQRYEEEFEHVTLAPAGNNGHAPVRQRGVYLVTGGLGGIGLAVALHLARHARARLVLTGRSPMPERSEWDAWLERRASDDPTSHRIRIVREIEALGAEVWAAAADVTDVEAMRGVIEETQRRFGALNGVVHAAGILHDSPILAKSQEEVEEVFAPKVHGTLVLDALLRDVDLDFLVLFSSTSAVIAPPGQVDYVAASAFLDAYARSVNDPTQDGLGTHASSVHALNGHAHGRNGTKRKRRTVSVNWGIWNEVGMAANALNAGSSAPAPAPGRPPRHPLFDTRRGDPDAPLLLEARYTPRTHWILGEHRTREGHAIVPGTAYLELARAALLEADENPVFEIRDLLLLRPLHVADGTTKEVQVELRPEVEGYTFTVRSRKGAPDAGETLSTRESFGARDLRSRAGVETNGAASLHDGAGRTRGDQDDSAKTTGSGFPGDSGRDDWQTNAEARLIMRTPRKRAPVPVAELEARCAVHRSAQGTLPSAQADLVRFGPRWQNLREVRLGQGEALVTVELRPEFARDVETFGLHPALVDIATSSGLELPELVRRPDRDGEDGTTNAPEELWVPISYKSVRVHGPLPARFRSWIRSHPTNLAGARTVVFDIVLFGDDGRVLLEIDEFAMRSSPRELDLTRAPAVTPVASSATGRAVRTPTRALARSEPIQRRTSRDDRASSPGLSALQHNFEQGITPEEGLEALQRILAAPGLPQVVATSLDLAGLRRQVEALGTLPETTRLARPELDTEFLEPPDGIERTLAGFWQELLGVRSVGVRDNFFDLGGHSLIAVRLFARIKKAYQVEFPISLLFEAPTIERCAEAIRRATGADAGARTVHAKPQEPRYTHLVPMHSGQGGDKTPFFLVAGMFGNVLNLRHLAHLLGNERRFFGLQALGLYGADKPRETFEEMASDYLAEVRRVQPNGPYLLGGFSGGGITAYEMAIELANVGEEVALLVMLDTALPRAPLLRANEKARIHWERMRRRGPAYATEWARDKLRWQISRMRERKRANDGAAMPSEFRSQEIGAAFRRALARYEMKPYDGAITLFRPKLEVAHVLGPGRMTNSRREFVFPDNGWGAHAAHVEVHEVPGDHDSMVLEPNVRVLAAKLRRCIQQVESGTRRSVLRSERHDAND